MLSYRIAERTHYDSKHDVPKVMARGSFYTEPPGVNHFAMTNAEGVVIQITSYGPTGTTYVDPQNDPARKP